MTVPGISRCFTRTQLQSGAISPADPIARRVFHGFYARRSGDVVVVYEPFKYLGDLIPATHGSPYSYDTHVPLIIMGASVTPGRYFQAATPADIAPTLASILGVQAPSNTVGRVLIEGITAAKTQR
jgi:arylsulfatase A-like enzyme